MRGRMGGKRVVSLQEDIIGGEEEEERRLLEGRALSGVGIGRILRSATKPSLPSQSLRTLPTSTGYQPPQFDVPDLGLLYFNIS